MRLIDTRIMRVFVTGPALVGGAALLAGAAAAAVRKNPGSVLALTGQPPLAAVTAASEVGPETPAIKLAQAPAPAAAAAAPIAQAYGPSPRALAAAERARRALEAERNLSRDVGEGERAADGMMIPSATKAPVCIAGCYDGAVAAR